MDAENRFYLSILHWADLSHYSPKTTSKSGNWKASLLLPDCKEEKSWSKTLGKSRWVGKVVDSSSCSSNLVPKNGWKIFTLVFWYHIKSLGSYYFFSKGGGSICYVYEERFVPLGPSKFFSHPPRPPKNILPPSPEADDHPLPIKNYSSLTGFQMAYTKCLQLAINGLPPL